MTKLNSLSACIQRHGSYIPKTAVLGFSNVITYYSPLKSVLSKGCIIEIRHKHVIVNISELNLK
jgi:hypothetical protein